MYRNEFYDLRFIHDVYSEELLLLGFKGEETFRSALLDRKKQPWLGVAGWQRRQAAASVALSFLDEPRFTVSGRCR